MAGRPDIRISARRKDAQKGDWGVDIAAAWREDGRVSGRWDRKIKRIKIMLDDGTVHDIEPAEWWLNVREESQPQQRTQQRSAGRTHTRVVADADVPNTDDIPF